MEKSIFIVSRFRGFYKKFFKALTRVLKTQIRQFKKEILKNIWKKESSKNLLRNHLGQFSFAADATMFDIPVTDLSRISLVMVQQNTSRTGLFSIIDRNRSSKRIINVEREHLKETKFPGNDGETAGWNINIEFSCLLSTLNWNLGSSNESQDKQCKINRHRRRCFSSVYAQQVTPVILRPISQKISSYLKDN